jgi:D-beta-D-heptose 7-phosphate kinase/D-beta-D-heptose 1-phosphate adenosyltransferase
MDDLWSRLDALGPAEVLVVGDLMLDRYLISTPARVSPEAPVLIVRHERETENPGGAGNVACNLAGLGLCVSILAIVGEDDAGQRLVRKLNESGVKTGGVLHIPNRPTTIKSRVTSGMHQLLRIDVEDTGPLPVPIIESLVEQLNKRVDSHTRAILLSDYAKGVVCPEIAQAAIALGRRVGIPVLVDPKGPDWAKYHGATMATPNRSELAQATGESIHDLDRLLAAAEKMRRQLELSFFAVTLGEQGITLLDEGEMQQLPSQAREVFDVSGAGDTVIATTAAALVAGFDRRRALELANLAAGIVVGKAGTSPIHREDLCQAIMDATRSNLRSKICDWSEAARRVENWRRQGQKIVFTNGCFDLVHAGHALHLEDARRLGNRLIVGLNSDRSIRGLKGEARPIQIQQDRAILLAAMAAVDAVVTFDEPTPMRLVLAVRPDIMVKGNDYAKEEIAGAADVESWGGKVVTLPLFKGKSTSAIIEQILSRGQ